MKRRVFLASCATVLAATALLKAEEEIKKAQIVRSKCVGCGDCVRACPAQAITLDDGKAIVIQEKCVSCRLCVLTCSYGAPR
jgi:Fe-S-cluster-containing hydrogenase component 2